MKQLGPWLQVAVFCESVADDDGGQRTYVGVHDGVKTEIGAGNFHAPVMALAFTGEGAVTAKLDVYASYPAGFGKKEPERVLGPETLRFDGPRFGRNLAGQIKIDLSHEGMWWFDVQLNGITITRMPFRVYGELIGES